MTPLVGGLLARPAGRWGLALALLALHLALALAATGLPRDDLETMFFAQGWAWGYDPEQPPLYNWLTQVLTDVMGPSLGAAIGLRWAIIAVGLGALYDAVRRMAGDDAALAAGAVAGTAGTALFGFEASQHFTHTALLLTATAAVLWAVARIAERASAKRYAVLGIALAVACLSKYTFAVFGLALVLAALTDPLLRARLWDRRILWAALPSLIALPGHLLWRLTQDMDLTDRVASITSQGGDGSMPLWERLEGLTLNVVLDPIAGMAPALVVIGVLGLLAVRRPTERPKPAPNSVRWVRVLAVFVLASMALTMAVVLASGGHRLRYHYMLPVAMVLPALALLWLRARGTVLPPWRRSAMGWGLAGLAVAFSLGVAANRLILEAWACDRCLPSLPIADAAEAARTAGFQGRGTILAASLDWGANLRRAFPEARVLARSRPDWRPPDDGAKQEAGNGGACLIVLFPDETLNALVGEPLEETTLPESVARLADVSPDAVPLDRAQTVHLPVTPSPLAEALRPGRGQSVRFGFLVVPDGLGTCR